MGADRRADCARSRRAGARFVALHIQVALRARRNVGRRRRVVGFAWRVGVPVAASQPFAARL